MDYSDLARLDWTRVKMAHLPAGTYCAHGLKGAPYCGQCLLPAIEVAISEQETERALVAARAQVADARSAADAMQEELVHIPTPNQKRTP